MAGINNRMLFLHGVGTRESWGADSIAAASGAEKDPVPQR
jgi:hypothetical protein